MQNTFDPTKRGLPAALRVCQCSGCDKHKSLFDDSDICGNPFLLWQGNECGRCGTNNCPDCKLECKKCDRQVCRACDGCDVCESFLCTDCYDRETCRDCGEKVCCRNKMCCDDICDSCGRVMCDDCIYFGKNVSQPCHGKKYECEKRFCPDCLSDATRFTLKDFLCLDCHSDREVKKRYGDEEEDD